MDSNKRSEAREGSLLFYGGLALTGSVFGAVKPSCYRLVVVKLRMFVFAARYFRSCFLCVTTGIQLSAVFFFPVQAGFWPIEREENILTELQRIC